MADSLNSYLQFDMITGKKGHFLREHLRAPTEQQALEHVWVRMLLGLGSCFLLYCLIDQVCHDLSQLSKSLGVSIEYFKHGRELEKEH